MAHKVSTGAQKRLKHEGVKEVWNDFLIKIYSAPIPAEADDAATGTLLGVYTKDGAAVPVANSTRQIDHIVVTRGSTGHIFTVTIGGVAVAYTQLAGDSTDDILAASIAAAINASTTAISGSTAVKDVVEALAVTGAAITESLIVLRARYAGEGYTLSVSSDGGTIVATSITANARVNSLHFGNLDSIYAAKESGVDWEATGLADGTAAYFRVVHYDDDGTLSTTHERLQGLLSTSGGDLTMKPSLQVALGAPLVVAAYTLNIKKALS